MKSVFKDAGKLAGKGALYAILVLIAFAIVNTLLFSVALYFYKTSEYVDKNYWFLIGILITGIVCLVLSFVSLYKYMIVEAIHAAYVHLRPFFRKLCGKLVEKESVAGGIEKTVNIDAILTEMYGRSIPSIIRKGISFVINLIPFVPILLDVKGIVKNGSNQEIEDAMFIEVDKYVTREIFNKNSVKSIVIIWIVNLVVQLGIALAMVYFFKSWGGTL